MTGQPLKPAEISRRRQRDAQSRHMLDLQRLVSRLTERVERGRIYERSIAAGNAALQAELDQAQSELSRIDRRAAS